MMGFCKFAKFSSLCLILLLYIVSCEDINAQITNDRASLILFMAGVTSDPQHALESWNSSGLHVCNWTGVGCYNANDRVSELDLHGRSLKGRISPALSNLSFLLVLDLSGNFFEGQIPAELGALSQLKELSLSSNLLKGKIPVEMGFLRQLVYLNLGSNQLVGEIPMSLFCNGSLSLDYIDLSNNSLGGEIPLQSQCGLKELRFLLLWSNRLVGRIPPALSNSSKLQWLDLESNSLTGELPSDIIDKMPHLQFLYLSYNNFFSPTSNVNLRLFFESLVNCSNFQELELAGNNLGGEIPSIIGDLPTSLVQVHLEENHFYGLIPPEFSNLVNLTLLNLSGNLLTGSIPPELCNMGKLERVILSNNSLSGKIPPALSNISHLGLLDLSKNMLSGSIPDSFSNLSQLRRLLLHENRLSGAIPPSLGKCSNLEILDLSHNKISGIIPSQVAGLRSLKLYLNLSSNFLHGPIPLELSKMDMVLAIDLSSNKLSGSIPLQLGNCIALEYLNLSGNLLQGPLPIFIGELPYLQAIDLSLNQLNGEIPLSVPASSSIRQLNLSFNNLSGNLPKGGVFSSLTVDSFQGNSGLCGSISGMPSCQRKQIHHSAILPILILLFAISILCMSGYPLLLKSRTRQSLAIFSDGDWDDEEEDERKQPKHPKISYRQLKEATGGFSGSSLIGSGRFGHVYKGVLHDNTRIAVKVLDLTAFEGISGSFKRECQILKRTRHRNLIRIISACNKPDFKALVLPLMSNGSLERHLYPSHGLNHGFSLLQLVNICSDVAEGVAYLHHHSPFRVIHCDLKPSNVLLDDDMTALVTDFGISRLVKSVDESKALTVSSSFASTDGLLCGSFGYIAPEYGLGKCASTQGDVYSFGILLLEIVTSKRPTDVLFQQGTSLREWVKSHYPYKLEPIVEQALLRSPPPTNTAYSIKTWQDVILELIELGLMCTQYSPSMRPNMLDVAHELGELKLFLSNPSNIIIEEASKVDST